MLNPEKSFSSGKSKIINREGFDGSSFEIIRDDDYYNRYALYHFLRQELNLEADLEAGEKESESETERKRERERARGRNRAASNIIL
jgi:hypothetical protein